MSDLIPSVCINTPCFPGTCLAGSLQSLDIIRWGWIMYLVFSSILILYLLLINSGQRKRFNKELDKLTRQNSELRLRSLQMQMNPHFVFNSLTSLQKLIIARDTREALIYLGLWAGVIRSNLENVLEEYIALTEEISFLEKYSQMEKSRFKGSLTIQFSNRIDDTRVLMPPMLIQPLIENAIKHGINNSENGGNINIDLSMEGNKIIIMVEDDGEGRANSELNNSTDHNGIGLGIIEKRLELLNKKLGTSDNRIEINDLQNNGKPSGTRVVITLSVIKNT